MIQKERAWLPQSARLKHRFEGGASASLQQVLLRHLAGRLGIAVAARFEAAGRLNIVEDNAKRYAISEVAGMLEGGRPAG